MKDWKAIAEKQAKLLEVAKCPACDGSGAMGNYDTNGNVEWEQCQWCDERKKLSALESQEVEGSVEMEGIKDKIHEEFKKGNIVVFGVEGLMTMPINEFIEQPADGILYDLNRNEAVILTFINDPKWINDYAVAKTIRLLKAKVEEYANSSKVTDDGELKVKRFLNHKFKDRPNPKDVNPYEAGATRKRK